MGGVPRGHGARQASKKHIAKAGQSTPGSSGSPKFFQQSGKASTVPKKK